MNPETYLKHAIPELKKQLGYLEQTNWYFQNDGIDFTKTNPFLNS